MGEVWCTRCHHNADPEVVSTEINGHMGGWMRKNCQAVNLTQMSRYDVIINSDYRILSTSKTRNAKLNV